jgi:PAS domain-containing protein
MWNGIGSILTDCVEEWGAVPPESAQKPLEIILARNLLTSLSTPAFLVDGEARLLFYNEAAGALLGRSFEDSGRMEPEDWTTTFGPFEDGQPFTLDKHPLTVMLRAGRPAHAEFCIRSVSGEEYEIEASGVPLVGAGDLESGAMILFWPSNGDES